MALSELRTTTAKLVLNFDMQLARGEDGKRLMYESRDHFTMDPGALDIRFTAV